MAALSGQAKTVAQGENGPLDFKQEVQSFEVALIQQALESTQFNQKRATKQLGLTYHQLRGYLRKYEMLG